jgi:hypothetical protein
MSRKNVMPARQVQRLVRDRLHEFQTSRLQTRVRLHALTHRLGNAPNLIHNGIVHGFASKSSSGVQMIGALRPFPAQTFSITGRIMAFAKWRQFHVNR